MPARINQRAERAGEVRSLLTSDEAAFLVVAAPEEEPAAAAVELVRRLEEDGFPFAGIVLNRVHRLPPGAPRDVDELARSPKELQATLDGLERWAADVHQRLA